MWKDVLLMVRKQLYHFSDEKGFIEFTEEEYNERRLKNNEYQRNYRKAVKA